MGLALFDPTSDSLICSSVTIGAIFSYGCSYCEFLCFYAFTPSTTKQSALMLWGGKALFKEDNVISSCLWSERSAFNEYLELF